MDGRRNKSRRARNGLMLAAQPAPNPSICEGSRTPSYYDERSPGALVSRYCDPGQISTFRNFRLPRAARNFVTRKIQPLPSICDDGGGTFSGMSFRGRVFAVVYSNIKSGTFAECSIIPDRTRAGIIPREETRVGERAGFSWEMNTRRHLGRR